nr:transposase [Amycolatopsis palatopharyngis]
MTSDVVSAEEKTTRPARTSSAQEQLAAAMVAQAQEQGLALTPDGLLKQLTKTVLETALNAEMTDHLGHAKHQDEPGRVGRNKRNGVRSKTVVSDAVGEVEVAVLRDREGSFDPVIVKKRQRR